MGQIYPAGDNRELVVLALNRIKAGYEQVAREELMKLIPLTNREPGCIFYRMHVNVGTEEHNYMVENPRFYMFYEIWRSRADWDKHMEMPYIKHWAEVAKEVCESWELYIWEKVNLPTNPVFRGGELTDPKEQYTLLALVDVKEGFEDRAFKEMLALVPLTHTEPGCIQYDMHVNLDMNTMARNYRKIMFYENWYNFKVWKVDHMQAGYLVRWFNFSPQVTEKIELTGWKMLDYELTYTGKEK
ncbi:MAG: antibiotic biosynthesis monooxygenase [Candidatus Caldatribacterium sp.]|uniref:putative quinol monooxygenase n=1 Tax=Candidatus Caldatribacterium sp. TaxID=2282143 RepID=UPI002996E841|nr:antibiotic biosynthesis monooxygenase [Candidatus Caldatribacterium sp.]MCX7730818.1 antibiotic biosynthesis monooxygenase [Candidatus Caldatribacterium sp.]MDW8080936.1 antibiotic biosynthesis monooxygenase [Candidatus Calescibacterium sp.]